MRIVDESGNDIDSPDLSAGCLVETIVLKRGAVPPDDVDKFAWADDDYERVARYVPYQQTVVEPDKTQRLASALSKATSLAQVRDAAKTILRG